jgi:hypothetical protein
MTVDPVSVDYHWDWSRAEHIRLHRALMRVVARSGKLRAVRVIFMLAAGAGVAYPLIEWARGNPYPLERAFPWMVLIGLWWGIFTWLLPRSSARAYSKLHRGLQRLRLTAEGVESGCDVCSSQLRWETFQRAVETPEFVFLFYTTQCAAYLPKRVVETPEALDRLRSFLQAHVPGGLELGKRSRV